MTCCSSFELRKSAGELLHTRQLFVILLKRCRPPAEGSPEAIADVLAVGKIFASMRCAHLAQSLPTISGPRAVGSLERQHPSWILRGKSADLIQLPKLVLCEC